MRLRKLVVAWVVGVLVLLNTGCDVVPSAEEAAEANVDRSQFQAPKGVVTTAGDSQILIQWPQYPTAKNYTLYWSNQLGLRKTNARQLGVDGTSYLHKDLTNGIPYYYAISATTDRGETNLSEVVPATPDFKSLNAIDSTEEKADQYFVVVGDNRNTLYWAHIAGATSYSIYWSNSDTGEVGLQDNRIDSVESPFVHDNLQNGKQYNYVVVANNHEKPGLLPQIKSAIPFKRSPTTPTDIVLTYSAGQLEIGFADVSNAEFFNLYWKNSPGVTLADQRFEHIQAPFVHTPLDSNTVYYYKLVAVNAGGESALSAEFSVDTSTGNVIPPTIGDSPNTPAEPSIDSGNQQITLGWDASDANTLGYNIYWTTDGSAAAGTAWNKIPNVKPPFTHTGLANEVPVIYTVTAINNNGESTNTPQKSQIPQLIKPGVPANVTVAAADARVAISWASVSGATDYNVYWRQSDASATQAVETNNNVLSPHLIENLQNGVSYTFEVSANNANGKGENSNPVSATPQIPRPLAPSQIIASAGNAQVRISWTHEDPGNLQHVIGYRLYWSGTPDISPRVANRIDMGLDKTFMHDSLVNGRSYYYMVTAINAGGESTPSAEIQALPLIDVPGAPSNVSTLPGDTQVTIDWQGMQTEANQNFNLYWWTEDKSLPQSEKTVVANVLPGHTVAGLNNGSAYHFYVAAVNVAGESIFSKEVIATPQVPPPSQSTATFETKAGDTEIQIFWEPIPTATSYKLYWSTTANINPNETPYFTDIQSGFTHTGLTNGHSYYYSISGVNAGGEGPLSNLSSATPQVPAPAVPPSNFTVTSSDAEVIITWDSTSVQGVDSYNVYWSNSASTPNSEWIKIPGFVSGDSHKKLNNGVMYYYQVTAVNAGGESPLSIPLPALPQVAPPAAPDGLAVSVINDTQVGLNWFQSTNVRYNLYRSTTPDIAIGATGVTKLTDTQAIHIDSGLIQGTIYYYALTAQNPGGESSLSPVVSAIPQLIPADAPKNLSATAGDAQTILSWQNVADSQAVYTLYWTDNPAIGTQLGSQLNAANQISNVSSPYQHRSLTNGTPYYYAVTASSSGSAESSASGVSSATPQVAPVGPPTGFSVAAGIGHIIIDWDTSNYDSNTSFNLYWTTQANTSPLNGNLQTNVTPPYIHVGTAIDTSFIYAVTAVNPAGESAPTQALSATAGAPPNTQPLIADGTVTQNGREITVYMSEDNSPLPFDLILNAYDNEGDTLFWNIANPQPLSSGATASIQSPGNSVIVSYTPALHFSGNDSFTATVSDGKGAADTITITVSLDPINDLPKFDNQPANLEAFEGLMYSYTAKVSDVETPVANLLISPVNLPAWMKPDSSINGELTVSGTPGVGDIGTTGNDVTLSVMDESGGIANQTFTLNVATGVATTSPVNSTAQVTNITAGQESLILIQAVDENGIERISGGDFVTVTVTGDNQNTDGSPLVLDPVDNGDGTYTATYLPTIAGADSIAITIGGSAIGGNPYTSRISSAAASATHSVAFVAPTGRAGTTTQIPVQVTDAFGNPTIATVLGSISTGLNSNAEFATHPLPDGSYIVSYTPTLVGTDSITITINGSPINESLFTSVVAPGAAVATTSTAAVPATGTAGAVSTITVTANDNNNNLTVGGDSVSVTVDTGSANAGATVAVTDNSNGTYTATYTPTASGTDNFTITVNGIPTAGPFSSIVISGAGVATNSTVTTPIPDGVAGSPTTLTITVLDQQGNSSTGSDSVLVGHEVGSSNAADAFNQTLYSGANGIYTASYTPSVPGIDIFTVTVNGQPIPVPVGMTAFTSNVGVGGLASNSSVTTEPLNSTTLLPGIAGQPTTITVTVRDTNSNPTAGGDLVEFVGRDQNGGVIVIQPAAYAGGVSDGIYTASYTPTVAGTDTITVSVNNVAIANINGTPIDFTSLVNPGPPSTVQSVVLAPVPTTGVVAVPTNILVELKDQWSNATTGIVNAVITPTATPNNSGTTFSNTPNPDGTYTVSYTPAIAGTDSIHLTIANVEIVGSPFDSIVSPAPVLITDVLIPTVIPDANLRACIAAEAAAANPQMQFTSELVFLTCIPANPAVDPLISDLTGIDQFFNLQQVQFTNNAIVNIVPLTALPALRSVYLQNNQITNLAPLLDMNPQLGFLLLGGNQIDDIGIAALDTGTQILPSLWRLDLANNPGITNLNWVQGITTLESFSVSNNGISDLLPMTSLTALRELKIHNNSISDLTPLSLLPNLINVDVRTNIVDNAGIVSFSTPASFPVIERLWLDDNIAVSNLAPVSGHNTLLSVRVTNTAVTDLTPLAALPNLTELTASNNGLDNTSATVFAPTTNFPAIQSLLLENNNIDDVSDLVLGLIGKPLAVLSLRNNPLGINTTQTGGSVDALVGVGVPTGPTGFPRIDLSNSNTMSCLQLTTLIDYYATETPPPVAPKLNPSTANAPNDCTVLPTSPAIITALAGDAQITVGWSAVSNATQYTIESSDSAVFTTSQLVATVPAPSVQYIHTGLVNGATIFYRIVAQNHIGDAAPSAGVSATPQPVVTNAQPVFVTVPADQTNTDNDNIVPITVSASDTDNDIVAYSVTGLPPGLILNQTTGVISGQIVANLTATTIFPVTITADDQTAQPNATTTTSFNWTVNPIAGVAVTTPNGTSLAEAPVNTSIPISVVLASQPAPGTTVTINFQSSDTTTATVSTASVSFSGDIANDWSTAKTVSVISRNDDFIASGPQTAIIALTMTSTDSQYALIDPVDVTVTVTDNDNPGIVVTVPSSSTIQENPALGTTTFTVALASQPANGNTVIVDIGTSPAGEITATTPLSFTSATSDWSTPKLVTLAGIDNTLVQGDRPVTINISINPATTEQIYNAQVAPSSLGLSVIDDDFVPLIADTILPDPALTLCIQNLAETATPQPLTLVTELTNLVCDPAVTGTIIDLTGIHQFPNITGVSLGNNNISDITPLTLLNNLGGIRLEFNSVSDLTALTTLSPTVVNVSLTNNQLTDASLNTINLSQIANIGITDLNIGNTTPCSPPTACNTITSLSVFSNFTTLKALSFGYLYNPQVPNGGGVSDLSPLAQLPNLTTILGNGNLIDNAGITSFNPPVGSTSFPALNNVSLDSNFIDDAADIALGLSGKLTSLYLNSNNLGASNPLPPIGSTGGGSIDLLVGTGVANNVLGAGYPVLQLGTNPSVPCAKLQAILDYYNGAVPPPSTLTSLRPSTAIPSTATLPGDCTALPISPATVNALAGDGQVTVSWAAVSNADQYTIESSSTAQFTTNQIVGTVLAPAVDFVHTGLVNGTTVFYRIIAQNNIGDSLPSAIVSDTPQAVITNAAPVFVSVPANQTNIDGEVIVPLTVSASDADNDIIAYSATGLPPGITISSTTGSLSGQIATNLTAGVVYPVALTANDQTTQPNATATASFNWTVLPIAGVTVSTPSGTSLTELPASTIPVNVVLASEPLPGTTVTINLQSSDITSATVTPASISFTNADWDITKSADVNSRPNDNVAGGDKTALISFTITSGDGQYASLAPPADIAVSVIDDDNPVIVVPVPTLSLTAQNGSIDLTMASAVAPDSYKVYFNTTGNVTKADAIAYSGSVNSSTHFGLTNNQVYYYRASAVIGGQEGLLTAEQATFPFTEKTSWTKTYPTHPEGSIIDVIYTGAQYIAIAGDSSKNLTIITSPDRVTWTSRQTVINPSNAAFVRRSLAHDGNGNVMMATYSGLYRSSDHGITWVRDPRSNRPSQIINESTRVYAVFNIISTSPASPTTPVPTFVAFIRDYKFTTIDNGVTWFYQQTNRNYLSNIIHDGSNYFGAGAPVSSDVITKSSDGVSWQVVFSAPLDANQSPTENFDYLSYAQNILYVGVSDPNGILGSSVYSCSTPAASFTCSKISNASSGSGFGSVAYSPTLSAYYRNAGGLVYKSITGTDRGTSTSLNLRNPRPTSGTKWIERGANSHLMLYGQLGTMASSTDGVNWTRNTQNSQIRHIIWDGSQFVGVGERFTTTSIDGAAWTWNANDNILYNVDFDGSIYTAVGFSATNVGGTLTVMPVVLTSTDAVTWSPETIQATPSARFLYRNASNATGSIRVAVGTDAQIYANTNGIWVPATITPAPLATSSFRSVAWNGVAFLAITDETPKRAYRSTDGLNWSVSDTSGNSLGQGIAVKDGIFYLSAYNAFNKSITSSDGLVWNEAAADSGAGNIYWDGVLFRDQRSKISPDAIHWNTVSPTILYGTIVNSSTPNVNIYYSGDIFR